MRGFRAAKERYIISQLHAGSNVLHIGCTNSPNTIGRWTQNTLLHAHLLKKSKELGFMLTGIDIDEDALQFMREKMPGEKLLNIDAHLLSDHFSTEKFDLIIAGDVIEHLPNPGQFLSSCKKVLAPRGKILITTVNAFGIVRFLKSFLFHEAVHSEHTAYYSHKTLKRLFLMSGLSIRNPGYYQCEPLKGQSFNLTFMVLAAGNLMENIFCLIWPHFSEGIIASAVSENE